MEDDCRESEEESPEGVEEAKELVARIDGLKTLGNQHFRQGEHEAALRSYSEALQLIDTMRSFSSAVTVALCANQALCLLKLDRFEDAEQRASAALVVDPSNCKAVFRRGQARVHLGDLRGAHEDLQKALRLDPQCREIRQKCEEVRKLYEAAPSDPREVEVAEGAVAALGMGDAGLYLEKPDLNEGRLAETHLEQREWVNTIKSWVEITDVCFAEQEKAGTVTVYMGLPGVHKIPKNKVCVWMHVQSLEVRVIDLEGTNWVYVAKELCGQIDQEASSWKVKTDKLVLKLHKRASARSWDKWDKLRRI